MERSSATLRRMVAREAATLLYSRAEKEYKQAKLKAARTLQTRSLPANLEVAIELDRIAEEREGSSRQVRLVSMRREALVLMKILKHFEPLLIGSVWRGTIRSGSDVDIIAHNDNPEEVVATLQSGNVRIAQTERVKVTEKGKRRSFFRIHAESAMGERIDIKVTELEAQREEICEIYGDQVVGLRIRDLERLLSENPTQRYLPQTPETQFPDQKDFTGFL